MLLEAQAVPTVPGSLWLPPCVGLWGLSVLSAPIVGSCTRVQTGSEKCRADVGRVSCWFHAGLQAEPWAGVKHPQSDGHMNWLTQKLLHSEQRQQCHSTAAVPNTCSCSDRYHSQAHLPDSDTGCRSFISCPALHWTGCQDSDWSWCHSSSGQSLPPNLKQHARNNYCFITRSVICIWKCLSTPAKLKSPQNCRDKYDAMSYLFATSCSKAFASLQKMSSLFHLFLGCSAQLYSHNHP